jgi:hypothetical protein
MLSSGWNFPAHSPVATGKSYDEATAKLRRIPFPFGKNRILIQCVAPKSGTAVGHKNHRSHAALDDRQILNLFHSL